MFIELFWPKPLKDAVAECREKGILNEEALEHIRKKTEAQLGLWLGLFIICAIVMEPKIVLLGFLGTPLFIWADLRMWFYRQLAPYLNAERVEVVVTRRTKSSYGEQYIRVKTLDSSKKYSIKLFTKPKIPSQLFPSKDDNIFVYHGRDSKKNVMPDILELKKKYSLDKTIIQ